MKGSKLGKWMAALGVAVAPTAFGDVIFEEDFESYSSEYDFESNLGADGNGWYAGRFEGSFGSPTADTTLWNLWGVQYGGVEDDAGLLLHLDLTGYEDVTVQFQWHTWQADWNDDFVAGWTTDSLTDANNNGVIDSNINWNNWNEEVRGRNNNHWNPTVETFNITGGSHVWLAFWLDGHEGDWGKFDNIIVTGTPVGEVVPEPASMALLGTGLAALIARQRRRKA